MLARSCDHGHPVSELTAEYSFNVGILGTTIGGGETYGSWEYLPEEAWPTTNSIAGAPDEPGIVRRFAGRPRIGGAGGAAGRGLRSARLSAAA